MNKFKDMNVREQALYKLCDYDDDGDRDPILDYVSILESILIDMDVGNFKTPTLKQQEVIKLLLEK